MGIIYFWAEVGGRERRERVRKQRVI